MLICWKRRKWCGRVRSYSQVRFWACAAFPSTQCLFTYLKWWQFSGLRSKFKPIEVNPWSQCWGSGIKAIGKKILLFVLSYKELVHHKQFLFKPFFKISYRKKSHEFKTYIGEWNYKLRYDFGNGSQNLNNLIWALCGEERRGTFFLYLLSLLCFYFPPEIWRQAVTVM